MILPAEAETFTWTGGGDTSSWSDADNWDQSTAPNANGDVVVFNDTGTYSSNSTINLSEDITVGVFNFTNLNRTLTLDGGGTYGFTVHSTSNQSRVFTADSNDDQVGTLVVNAPVLLDRVDSDIFDITIGKSSVQFNQSVGLADTTDVFSSSFNSSPENGSGIFINNTFNTNDEIDLNNGSIYVSANSNLGSQAINFDGSQASGFRSIIATENATLGNELVNMIGNSTNVTRQLGVGNGVTLTLSTNSIKDESREATSLWLFVDSTDTDATGTIQFTGDNLLSTSDIRYEVQEGITMEFAPAESSDTQTINGKIKNVGDVLKTGEGTTTLVDMESKGQTTVNAGTLNITGGSGNYQPTGVTVNGGTLNLNTSPDLDTTDNVTVTVSGGTLNFNAEIGTINTLDLSAGEVGVNAKIDQIENLNQSGGTISFGNNHVIETVSTYQISGADVTVDSSFKSIDTIMTSGGASVNVSETIDNLGSVFVGGGTVSFNADNTLTGGFDGAILASAGSVLVNATLTANDTVEFIDDGKLGGTGTLVISAGQTFEMAGRIGPGEDGEIGTLAVDFEGTNASLDLSLVDRLVFELGADMDSDLFSVMDADINLGDSFSFDLFSFSTTDDFVAGSEYVLFTTTGSFLGDFTSDTGTVNGFVSSLFVDGNQLKLNVSTVPEPGTGALLLAGLGAYLLRRRRTSPGACV
ncbi:MAG: PEP-CTERM sorting domain-containing protein [Verrucomicrobiota bacterium]